MTYGSRRPTPRRRGAGWGMGALVVGVIGLIVVVIIGIGLTGHSNREVVGVKVVGKERVCDRSSNGGCKYLVFTDQGTFENTDALFEGKFNSSDIYGQLQQGKVYTFVVEGRRIPFFSMYPNIIEVRRG